ncbi:MAG TPA: hypothetical protein PLO62_03430 [Candidatus Hydrogenedentes bacterium]|nr:hypothetical protein [Candidatus Hydrogenedentota bacterium]HOS02470.1 hypothetical protein [Candidatus Hydrogenedentota bacterium]
MQDEIRPGYYKDANGEWQKDRRKVIDRRLKTVATHEHHERRVLFRRKADRELFECDHRKMIEDALEEFAADHEQPHEDA